jgi:hypothetical protein
MTITVNPCLFYAGCLFAALGLCVALMALGAVILDIAEGKR